MKILFGLYPVTSRLAALFYLPERNSKKRAVRMNRIPNQQHRIASERNASKP